MPCWPCRKESANFQKSPQTYTHYPNGQSKKKCDEEEMQHLEKENQDLKKRLDQSYATVSVSVFSFVFHVFSKKQL